MGDGRAAYLGQDVKKLGVTLLGFMQQHERRQRKPIRRTKAAVDDRASHAEPQHQTADIADGEDARRQPAQCEVATCHCQYAQCHRPGERTCLRSGFSITAQAGVRYVDDLEGDDSAISGLGLGSINNTGKRVSVPISIAARFDF